MIGVLLNSGTLIVQQSVAHENFLLMRGRKWGYHLCRIVKLSTIMGPLKREKMTEVKECFKCVGRNDALEEYSFDVSDLTRKKELHKKNCTEKNLGGSKLISISVNDIIPWGGGEGVQCKPQ